MKYTSRKSKKNSIWIPALAAIMLVSLTACNEFLQELDVALDEYELTAEATATAVRVDPEPSRTVVDEEISEATATAAVAVDNTDADFDFYVLNLSWSPDYCATNGDDDPQQCSAGRKLGFVLHGLWPQYNKGYPSDCSNEKLPADVEAQFPGLYPNTRLYDHEWEKHGTCSGLTPEEYLSLSKQLKESLNIPRAYQKPETTFRVTGAQLQEAFVGVNAGFDASSFAPYCSDSGRFLKELYVCFTVDGQPTSCSEEIIQKSSKSCGRPDFLVRNIR